MWDLLVLASASAGSAAQPWQQLQHLDAAASGSSSDRFDDSYDDQLLSAASGHMLLAGVSAAAD